MKRAFLVLTLFLAACGAASAGSDNAYDTGAVGEGGYDLSPNTPVALRPEPDVDSSGLQTVAYRDPDGRKVLDEIYFKDSLVMKKYFNPDESARKTVYYIYNKDIQVVKSVHRYSSGREEVVDEVKYCVDYGI